MTKNNSEHIGVDYGSKLAGTTVLAFKKEEQVHFFQSKKKQDADVLIESWLSTSSVKIVFIDAPLSLPIVYKDQSLGQNYFYREADQDLKAMSPMFLGGLTARAMRLKAHLIEKDYTIHEVYPGQLAKHLNLPKDLYKKDKAAINSLSGRLEQEFQLELAKMPENWHQFDALLAYISGLRFLRQEHLSFGQAQEGVIII